MEIKSHPIIIESSQILKNKYIKEDEALFKTKCEELSQKYSFDEKLLNYLFDYLQEIKNTHRCMNFVLSYILYLASIKIKNHELKAEYSFSLGRAAIMINRNPMEYGIKPLLSALDFFESNDSPSILQIRTSELLAKGYRNLGKYEEALAYYQQAIDKSYEFNNIDLAAYHKYCLGKMYVNYLKQPLRGLNSMCPFGKHA